MPVLSRLYLCRWPRVVLSQQGSTHHYHSTEPLHQANVGRIPSNSFTSDSAVSALLNFWAGGGGREVGRLSWDMSVLHVHQRVTCPMIKGPLNEKVVDFIRLWKPTATQVCCGSLSERKNLLQPAICIPLRRRMLGFINLKCSSVCSLCLGVSVFV